MKNELKNLRIKRREKEKVTCNPEEANRQIKRRREREKKQEKGKETNQPTEEDKEREKAENNYNDYMKSTTKDRFSPPALKTIIPFVLDSLS